VKSIKLMRDAHQLEPSGETELRRPVFRDAAIGLAAASAGTLFLMRAFDLREVRCGFAEATAHFVGGIELTEYDVCDERIRGRQDRFQIFDQ
jgi:hypothetical protein